MDLHDGDLDLKPCVVADILVLEDDGLRTIALLLGGWDMVQLILKHGSIKLSPT